MPIEILMPALSPTMTEGVLAQWCKSEGDKIQAGDVIAEIETDKATMEIEAPEDGILGKILITAGSKAVKINSVIALLLLEGEDKSALDKVENKAAVESSSEESASSEISKDEEIESVSVVVNDVSASSETNDKETEIIFASPLAKRIAAQNNIILTSVKGSGPKGRIIKSDILDTINNMGSNQALSQQHNIVRHAPSKIPVTGLRKSIANKLTEVKRNIPHFYLQVEINVDKLLEMRADINKDCEIKNTSKISVNDLIIKATALAFKDMPEANVSWQDTHIDQYHNIDAAVAVTVEGGIFTPIVKDADKKSVFEISKEVKELVIRAKAGDLKSNEFLGGSFTISNLGMYNIDNFTAILNPPQSCIFAIGKAKKMPVIENNQIVIRNIMSITISCDHRTIDGAVCANLINKVKYYLENPFKLLI